MGRAVKLGSAMAIEIRRGTEADIDEFVRLSHAIWRHTLAQQLGVGVEQWPMIAGLMRVELIPIARAILVAARGPQPERRALDRTHASGQRQQALEEDLAKAIQLINQALVILP